MERWYAVATSANARQIDGVGQSDTNHVSVLLKSPRPAELALSRTVVLRSLGVAKAGRALTLAPAFHGCREPAAKPTSLPAVDLNY